MKTNNTTLLDWIWSYELFPKSLDWGLLMLRSVAGFYLLLLHGLG